MFNESNLVTFFAIWILLIPLQPLWLCPFLGAKSFQNDPWSLAFFSINWPGTLGFFVFAAFLFPFMYGFITILDKVQDWRGQNVS